MGGNELHDAATKTSLEGGDAGVAVVLDARRGDTPKVETLDALGLEVFDGLPKQGGAAGKFAVEVGGGSLKIFGFCAKNKDEAIGDGVILTIDDFVKFEMVG